MIVRKATLSDIPAVAALERAEFPDGADEGMLTRLWETDGGVILDPDNVKALRQNGPLIFLDRPLSLLTSTADRPLSSDKTALAALYEKRYPLYLSAADKCVPAVGSVAETAEILRKELALGKYL